MMALNLAHPSLLHDTAISPTAIRIQLPSASHPQPPFESSLLPYPCVKTKPQAHPLTQDASMTTQVSLWLLPPPSISEPLQMNIAELAEKYQGSSPFKPHVTIVGGIPCKSPTNLGTLLSQGLQGFGGIQCRFRKEVVSMSNPDNTLVWNQACVSVMERSKEFMLLNKRVRELLGMESEEWEFPAPLGEPHLSHYYGTQKAPCAQDVIRFDDFTAVEAALWETSGGFEGVKNWKELPVARIKLTGKSSL